MTSMSIQEGLKIHGVDGKASVMKEIHNLVSRECFDEVSYKSLSDTNKKQALPILMFMLLKQDGRLKSRGCTDRHPRRLWTTKQEVSLPTPAFEALKYVFAIIGLEACDVTSFALSAQFLQTDMDEVLYLKITGALALLLVEYDRDPWGKYLQKE